MRPRFLPLVVLLIACCGFTSAQDNVLNSYTAETIAATIKRVATSAKPDGDHVFAAESFMIRARLTFTGASRKLSDNKRRFLVKWFKNNQYPDDFINRVDSEHEFKEADKVYWLAMQSVVAPHFDQEIKSGAQADLYLIFLGWTKEKDGQALMALVNEFKRPEDEAPSGPRTGNLKQWDEGVLKGFERYQWRTLKEIIQDHSEGDALKRSDIILTGDTFPSRVKLTYTGQQRALSSERKRHVEMVKESFKIDPKVIAKYETEMLFMEGKDEYWLLVQKELFPFFEKEIQKGETVVIYAEWVGANKFAGKWDWIFFVHEFQKY